MSKATSSPQEVLLALASAWGRLERRLDGSLSNVRGISFAEYRILHSLASTLEGRASRVDLATAVGLTPSGVTRALRPLEKIGIVTTERSDRDARLALASLTKAGRELYDDASGVVDDVLGLVLRRVDKKKPTLSDVLEELQHAT
jgi:DNA-binding MarR family transcriptional regulator